MNAEGAFALGGCGAVSSGEHFEWKAWEGCVRPSSSWMRLPGVPPVTPRPLATVVPEVFQWGGTDFMPFHLPHPLMRRNNTIRKVQLQPGLQNAACPLVAIARTPPGAAAARGRPARGLDSSSERARGWDSRLRSPGRALPRRAPGSLGLAHLQLSFSKPHFSHFCGRNCASELFPPPAPWET